MKYCKKCGYQVDSSYKFCSKCGNTIEDDDRDKTSSNVDGNLRDELHHLFEDHDNNRQVSNQNNAGYQYTESTSSRSSSSLKKKKSFFGTIFSIIRYFFGISMILFGITDPSLILVIAGISLLPITYRLIESGFNLGQKGKSFLRIVSILLPIFLLLSPTPDVPTNTEKEPGWKAGTYKIGVDLPEGEYILVSSDQGYFDVSSDSSGKLGSIITNDVFISNSIISVFKGQYFTFKNCRAYRISEYELKNKNSSGMFKVGLHIEPGEYKVKSTGDMAYIEVSSDSRHVLSSIITNDVFESEKYITVKDGQYIKIQNATFSKVTGVITTPKPEEPGTEKWEASMYKVGEEIPEGEYVLLAKDSGGYFEIAKDSLGLINSIIANGIFSYNSIVTIKKGQYFKLQGAIAYKISDMKNIDTSGEGMFKIGFHLPAGEYKIKTIDGFGYISVSKDSSHNISSLISNDIFENVKYITVKNGQYLIIQGAKIEK